MRIALDTNVLAYAEGVNGPARRSDALSLLRRLRPNELVLPVQAAGELYNVLVRKRNRTPDEARARVASWRLTLAPASTSPAVMQSAIDLATDHRLSVWDAVIVAAASSVGCTMLLSEDMQDGFVWGGVTVANPFAAALHPRLRTLLDSRPA